MSTCIFPGRFQPFHNGHLLVVQGMMKACGRAVIVICEGGEKKDDLFTTDEVKEMISAALLGADIVDANIATVTDSESDSEWVDKVLEAAEQPEEALVWSGHEEVREMFEVAGVKTQKISPVPGIVGEELREMIKSKNTEWRTKVPAGALDVIWKKYQGD